MVPNVGRGPDPAVPQGETCACTPSDGLGGAEQPDVGKSLGTEIRYPLRIHGAGIFTIHLP